jgi:hypothetical protein
MTILFFRRITRSLETNEFPYKDVRSWLTANGLEKYSSNFEKVPLKMLPFLRRSDLASELRIPLFDVPRIWKALKKLPRTNPPPFDPIDETVFFDCCFIQKDCFYLNLALCVCVSANLCAQQNILLFASLLTNIIMPKFCNTQISNQVLPKCHLLVTLEQERVY